MRKKKAKAKVRVKRVVKVAPNKQLIEAELEIEDALELPVGEEIPASLEIPGERRTWLDWLKSVFSGR